MKPHAHSPNMAQCFTIPVRTASLAAIVAALAACSSSEDTAEGDGVGVVEPQPSAVGPTDTSVSVAPSSSAPTVGVAPSASDVAPAAEPSGSDSTAPDDGVVPAATDDSNAVTPQPSETNEPDPSVSPDPVSPTENGGGMGEEPTPPGNAPDGGMGEGPDNSVEPPGDGMDVQPEAPTGDPGTCTASEPAGTNASGTGPHEVIVEINSDPGINEGTIYRPADLGGDEKYPIFVWGEGACSTNGTGNAAAMAEIASHGYMVIADGTPGGSGNRPMDRANLDAMGAPLIAYVDWAIAENSKPCSVYYQSLDVDMVSSNGFSCGGLMAQGTITDPRIVTWGVTSSGMAGANQAFYDTIHTPVLFVEGGPDEVAYDGGLDGYESIAQLGVPVMWFSKDLGHGGDLYQANGGDFTKINLAWLNWWLKGDETATGKGMLVGADCPFCSDSEWEVMSANLP